MDPIAQLLSSLTSTPSNSNSQLNKRSDVKGGNVSGVSGSGSGSANSLLSILQQQPQQQPQQQQPPSSTSTTKMDDVTANYTLIAQMKSLSSSSSSSSSSFSGSGSGSANSLLSILQQQQPQQPQQLQQQQPPSSTSTFTSTTKMDDVTANYTLIAQMKSLSSSSSSSSYISAYDEYLVYVNKKGCRVINMNNTTFTVIKKGDIQQQQQQQQQQQGDVTIKRVMLKKGGILFIEYSTNNVNGVVVYRIQHSAKDKDNDDDDDDELKVKLLKEYSTTNGRIVETNSPEGCLYKEGRYELLSISSTKNGISFTPSINNRKYSKLYRISSTSTSTSISMERLIGYDDHQKCLDLIDVSTSTGKVIKSFSISDFEEVKLMYYCNGTLYYVVSRQKKDDSKKLILNCLNDELEFIRKDIQLPKEFDFSSSSTSNSSTSSKFVMRNKWIYSYNGVGGDIIIRFNTESLKVQRISSSNNKKDSDGKVLEFCVYGRELYCVAEYGVYMLEIDTDEVDVEEEEEEELKEVKVLDQKDQDRRLRQEADKEQKEAEEQEEEEVFKVKEQKIIGNPFGLVKENSSSVSPVSNVPATVLQQKKKGIKILQRNAPSAAAAAAAVVVAVQSNEKEEGVESSRSAPIEPRIQESPLIPNFKEELEKFKKDLEKIIRRECKFAVDKMKEELLQSVKMEIVQMKKEILLQVASSSNSTAVVMANGFPVVKEKTVLERALDLCREKGDYEHAFVLVLESMDEQVLMEFLGSDDIFSGTAELDVMKLLSQAVLISLLHFLISSGFESNGEKKISWIERAALCIQKNHPVTRQYSHVLRQCADRMEGHCSAVLVRFVQNLAE
ncbi:hypothetical protein MP638_000337 [Amoeboaphelidium occidentale]|nr:hypothetical protein MP638_000337 [Amoeboaphelidium occidentale]